MHTSEENYATAREMVEQIKLAATDPRGTYFMHRHDGEHDEGLDCWCSPVALTFEQVQAHTNRSLEEFFIEFLQTH